MNFNLHFEPQGVNPIVPGHYLLYNQCDGYHEAEGRFKDGAFDGFFCFMGHEFQPDTYQAWARLPDTECLYELFADKPIGGKSARGVTRDRLRKQADALTANPKTGV